MYEQKLGFHAYAVFLYCCPDYLSCQVKAIEMGQASWAVWIAVKEHCLIYKNCHFEVLHPWYVCFVLVIAIRPRSTTVAF